MKKIFRLIISIIIIAIAAFAIFFGYKLYKLDQKYGYHFPYESFADNGKSQPYSLGIPLHEMDLSIYNDYVMHIIACSDSNDNSGSAIALPCDINYYQYKEDTTPALTLKKGTVVYINPDNYKGVGYGIECWPDYDDKWRYGCPFVTEDIEFNAYESPMYYVKNADLEKVAKEYRDINLKHFANIVTAWHYPKRAMEYIDQQLYTNGAFCPNRWKDDSERLAKAEAMKPPIELKNADFEGYGIYDIQNMNTGTIVYYSCSEHEYGGLSVDWKNISDFDELTRYAEYLFDETLKVSGKNANMTYSMFYDTDILEKDGYNSFSETVTYWEEEKQHVRWYYMHNDKIIEVCLTGANNEDSNYFYLYIIRHNTKKID